MTKSRTHVVKKLLNASVNVKKSHKCKIKSSLHHYELKSESNNLKSKNFEYKIFEYKILSIKKL